MTHVRCTMPTMGAEILTQLMLLDLFIQEMTVKTTLRIHTQNPQLWDGIRHGKLRGHLYQALQILKDHAISSQRIDMEGTWRWDKKFTVTRDNVLATSSSIRCYSRGTMFKDKIEWGCHIVDDSISYNLRGSLGFRASVLQAEIHEISQAASSLSWQQRHLCLC